MKRRNFVLALALLAASVCGAKEAKYIFYFIGDGMGVNQLVGTQMYLAELQGRIGYEPLCFTQFPATAYGMSYSSTNGVTDSAAGGTALACGDKTGNQVLGLLPDRKTPTYSIAVRAKQAGMKVGICTTVGIDHATPAAFYAHMPNRNSYHEIGMQLAESGFDFFAGGNFHQNLDSKNPEKDKGNIANAEKKGYTVVYGYDEFKKKEASAKKMILLPNKEVKGTELPYRIDRTDKDLTIGQITEAAIDFLMKDGGKNGFFCMIEGGKIDGALHGNDARAAFDEVIDMDDAIKTALDFYNKHPEETLIVVSADHETGGLVLGLESYRLDLKLLQYQDMSEGAFTNHLQEMSAKAEDGILLWDEVEAELRQHFGFWDKVRLTDAQTGQLRQAYVETFGMGYGVAEEKQEEYYKVDKLSDLAVKIISERAQIAWGTGAHTAGYVPVYAIGAGQNLFHGQINNIEIPKKIAEAAGLKW